MFLLRLATNKWLYQMDAFNLFAANAYNILQRIQVWRGSCDGVMTCSRFRFFLLASSKSVRRTTLQKIDMTPIHGNCATAMPAARRPAECYSRVYDKMRIRCIGSPSCHVITCLQLAVSFKRMKFERAVCSTKKAIGTALLLIFNNI